MLDSGSNTSFILKNVTKKLGLSGPKLHLPMNLVGGQKKSEESELVKITVVPISQETIQKPMQVYAINKGVKPTVFCTCKDNELKENKFKSIADSTEIVDGRIQESNYDAA